jgi:DNA processing protein
MLVTSAADVVTFMEWAPTNKRKAPVQAALFTELQPEEQDLVDVLRKKGKVDIDTLCVESRVPQGKAAGLLLNLEFNGVVRSLPGKVYALN